jgi:hypothetical protein
VKDNNTKVFLKIVEAGLWEKEVSLSSCGEVDFDEIYRLAQEQAVIGLVAAGIDRSKFQDSGFKIPQALALSIAGEVLQLEQRNRAMNEFVARLIEDLRKADIYTLLVKGQGIAQCYERPLWRACGDVDLLLSKENYDKAKVYLTKLTSEVEEEEKKKLHLGMTIDGWIVELHGALFTEFSRRLNKVIVEVLASIFTGGEVRSWENGNTTVFLPSPDNDVILVFSHILDHFFIEGVGLRQVCDWCRLLWTCRESLDLRQVEERLRKAGIIREWKAFASLAVDTLGMPVEAMPLYDSRFKVKGSRILKLVLETGNFGHNKDLSYRTRYKGVRYKLVSLWRRFCDFVRFTFIFPLDAPRFFMGYLLGKIR